MDSNVGVVAEADVAIDGKALEDVTLIHSDMAGSRVGLFVLKVHDGPLTMGEGQRSLATVLPFSVVRLLACGGLTKHIVKVIAQVGGLFEHSPPALLGTFHDGGEEMGVSI